VLGPVDTVGGEGEADGVVCKPVLGGIGDHVIPHPGALQQHKTLYASSVPVARRACKHGVGGVPVPGQPIGRVGVSQSPGPSRIIGGVPHAVPRPLLVYSNRGQLFIPGSSGSRPENESGIPLPGDQVGRDRAPIAINVAGVVAPEEHGVVVALVQQGAVTDAARVPGLRTASLQNGIGSRFIPADAVGRRCVTHGSNARYVRATVEDFVSFLFPWAWIAENGRVIPGVNGPGGDDRGNALGAEI